MKLNGRIIKYFESVQPFVSDGVTNIFSFLSVQNIVSLSYSTYLKYLKSKV